MKRLVSLAVAFFIAALFSLTAALAQEPAVAPSPAGTTPSKKEPAKPVPDQPGVLYKRVRVIRGGNLALIAEECGHRQTEWPALAAANPNLPKPEKVGEMWRVWIQPNQVLNLPAGWSYSTLNPEAVEPAPSRAGGLSILTPVVEIPPSPASAMDSNRSLWRVPPEWLLVLLAMFAIMAALIWVVRGFPPIYRRRDPSRYPARISGGLSDDPETATRQIGIAYPGRRYVRIRRCRLVRHYGPRHVVARRMDFGDGRVRDVHLNDGDLFYQGTTAEGRTDNFLTACGNHWKQEGVEVPDGWEVVIIESQDVASTVYEPPMTASLANATASTSPTTAPEPTPAPAPTPTPEPEPEPEPAPAEPLAPAEEPAVVKKTAEEIPTSNEVEITIGDLLIKVATGNGHIPATKIRTGDGVEVTLQQP